MFRSSVNLLRPLAKADYTEYCDELIRAFRHSRRSDRFVVVCEA